MWNSRLATLVVLVCVAAGAQTAPSAKKQEVNDLVTKASKYGAGGDKAAAVGFMETALQMVQKDPELKDDEIPVLRHLARAYVDAQRAADGVRAYRIVLDLMKGGCSPGGRSPEECSEIQFDMGTAQMYQGDFAGAVITLRASVAHYDTLLRGGYSADYKIAKTKLQGNAQKLLAAALFRAGKKAEAIAAFEKAIAEYTTVVNSPVSSDGLRAGARGEMRDAQTSLDLLRKDGAAAKK